MNENRLKVGNLVRCWGISDSQIIGLVLEKDDNHTFLNFQFLGQPAGWGTKTTLASACRILWLGDKKKEKVWIEDTKLVKIC